MRISNKLISSTRSTGNLVKNFWLSHFSSIFVLALLATTMLGGYIWYQTTYSSGWSKEQKDQYLASNRKDVNFQGQLFRDILSSIEKRKDAFNFPLTDTEGFFKLDE